MRARRNHEPEAGREVAHSDQEWHERLTPLEYEVMRRQGTERAYTGEYCDCHDDGAYRCRGCGAELFRSDSKFESGTGWPSFTEPSVAANIEAITDRSHFMVRTEVNCQRCGSHLGHVFEDGPAPTGLRYCINSVSLELDREA